MLVVDLVLLGAGAYCLYLSTEWLVAWLSTIKTDFISAKHLGWLSGWLMVLPNAFLAFYYARRGNPEVVYSSQIGDGHICIPLCIGIFALHAPAGLPPVAVTGFTLLMVAAALHFAMIAIFGRLPRPIGGLLVAAYAYFLYQGVLR
jgi:cation:H+ antiporter